MLGKTALARERELQMMAAVAGRAPYDMAFSRIFSGQLRCCLRAYDEAEVLLQVALELAEKHKFPHLAAVACCALGHARAERRMTGAVELVCQGIDGLQGIGARMDISRSMAILAVAQEAAGDIVSALETIEQAIIGGAPNRHST
jgi:hypothetical protein